MMGSPELTKEEAFVLDWLSKEDSSAYGECRGRSLDRLVELGYARTDLSPTDYSRVSLTEAGFARLAASKSGETA